MHINFTKFALEIYYKNKIEINYNYKYLRIL